MSANDDAHWMGLALQQAELATQAGEVPVGAVVVLGDQCIASAFNQPISSRDATAHAEIVALREAALALDNYRLPDTTLYVTIEPCTMCYGAMVHARVKRLVYGAAEPRAGIIASQLQLDQRDFYNHKIQCTAGVREQECATLMQNFFKSRR